MIELVSEYFLAIALFFSFITLIFYGFPVAWTMGGLGVIFIIISMLSDSLFDTFYGKKMNKILSRRKNKVFAVS